MPLGLQVQNEHARLCEVKLSVATHWCPLQFADRVGVLIPACNRQPERSNKADDQRREPEQEEPFPFIGP